MGRTKTAIEERKSKRKKRVAEHKKTMKKRFKKEVQDKERVMEELVTVRGQLGAMRKLQSPKSFLLTSVSKARRQNKRNTVLTGGPAELTSDVVANTELKISEGTFGVVHIGELKKLRMKCAIKSGKTIHLFDAKHEANVLQRLQGSMFFPHLFGILGDSVVMEYIGDDNGSITIYKARVDSLHSQNEWIRISFMLLQAIMFMHANGLLHNDIKSNNVLLKHANDKWIPIVVDMGKVTSRKNAEIYKLSDKQRERYNHKYPHLAYELRNKYGAKTSTATDIYSLGYLFKFLCDKETDFLKCMHKGMLEICVTKRSTSPDLQRHFKNWMKKNSEN